MRNLFILSAAVSVILCLAVNISALEQTIAAPGNPEYGKPTSFEPVVTADGGAMKNENLSKNAALVPPAFGSPTSYLPGSGEYLTPNLAGKGVQASASVINGSAASVTLPESGPLPQTVTASSVSTTSTSTAASSTGFTTVTSDLYNNGCLGTLSIPSLNLNVNVVEGTDDNALAKGAGHFTDTSIWDGNVCLAGHNRGVNCYFGEIHTLRSGDRITFSTRLGTRNYSVISVEKVGVMDNARLAPTTGNQISLFTCVRDQSEYRWCVVAVAE